MEFRKFIPHIDSHCKTLTSSRATSRCNLACGGIADIDSWPLFCRKHYERAIYNKDLWQIRKLITTPTPGKYHLFPFNY